MTPNTLRIALGAALALLVLAIVWIAAATVGSNRSITNLGDDQFSDVRAASVIADVAEGGPVFYRDLTGGERDIWITHIGDDPANGFIVLSAVAPSGCLVQWDRQTADFFDICDETVRFPPNGEGLAQYPVELDDGKLIIDLNFESRQPDESSDSFEWSPTEQEGLLTNLGKANRYLGLVARSA